MWPAVRMTIGRLVRRAWAAPASAVGLLLACLAARRGHVQMVDGVVEAHGPWLGWCLRHLVPIPGGAAAITFGHVVLATDGAALDLTRAHERIHVQQYERLGPLFIPAYLAASAWMALKSHNPYLDNPFEVEAWRRECENCFANCPR
jgi:hypothetical protein